MQFDSRAEINPEFSVERGEAAHLFPEASPETTKLPDDLIYFFI